MFSSKSLLPLFVLCLVQGSISKPFANNITEGRGIGSTIWGWITYPFTWWSTDVSDVLPEKDQLVKLNPINSYDIWCNDQTCTTTKCNKTGCVNVTCNIYDTDLTGECRNYNTEVKPEEPTTPKFIDSASKPLPQDKETDVTKTSVILTTATPITTTNNSPVAVEDRPLELEAVLSSTVTKNIDKEIPTQEMETVTNDQ